MYINAHAFLARWLNNVRACNVAAVAAVAAASREHRTSARRAIIMHSSDKQ